MCRYAASLLACGQIRAGKHLVLRCPLCSADELPFFQCFFVEEDEIQFPFYSFSPLHIWRISLNPVWGLLFCQFNDNDMVTFHPELQKHGCGSSTLSSSGTRWTAGHDGWFYVMESCISFQNWLSSRTKYMQSGSFLFIYLFFIIIILNVLIPFERSYLRIILNGTIKWFNFCGSFTQSLNTTYIKRFHCFIIL